VCVCVCVKVLRKGSINTWPRKPDQFFHCEADLVCCSLHVVNGSNISDLPPSPHAGLPVDVRSWTIPQVVKFFESTSDCKDYASVFCEQEVNGTALLLLTHESLKSLGMKLGPALMIMAHVEKLRSQHP